MPTKTDSSDLNLREFIMYVHAPLLVWCHETQSDHILREIAAAAANLDGYDLEVELAPKMEQIYWDIPDGKALKEMTDITLPEDAIERLDRVLADT